MKVYFVKRLLLMIPTLFGITVISFLIIRLAPGDPAELRAQGSKELTTDGKDQINQEIIEATRRIYKLDKPLHIQYFNWVGQIITFDFGDSFQDHSPVTDKIKERLPITLALSLLSIFIAYVISIPLGIFSGTHQYSLWDKTATFMVFVLYSLPEFWIATLCIIFFCGGDFLSIFPPGGIKSIMYSDNWTWLQKAGDILWHLILPVICLTYASFAYLSRQMRAGMLETIRQDFIRTARAKGLSEHMVVYKHALRNSVIPIITMIAYLLPALLGGSFILETIFSIPGMGKLGFDAILYRDYPIIMAIFTIGALLTLLGIFVSDILYALVDPRISFEKQEV